MSEQPKPKKKMRGGVVQRGSTWSYVIRATDPETGRSKPQWTGGFRTQKEAKAARAKALADTAQGTYVKPRKVTVKTYLAEWLDGRATKLKPSTLASYKRMIDTYAIPALGGDRLDALTPPRLQAFYAALLAGGGAEGKPLSVRSVRYVHGVLHKALADAVRMRSIPLNPASLVELPTRPAGDEDRRAVEPIHAWTVAEVHKFTSAVAGDPLAPLFGLAINNGLRRSELLALTWADVDLDAERLHVRQGAVTVGQQIRYSTPKSGKTRSFRLDPVSLAILRDRRREQAAQKLAWPGEWGNDRDLVFTHEDGRPILGDHVTKRFRRLCDALDVSPLRFHDLRHTYATLALEAGVPIKVVSQRLGHATVQITWDTYAHVLPDMDDQAATLFHAHVYGALANR